MNIQLKKISETKKTDKWEIQYVQFRSSTKAGTNPNPTRESVNARGERKKDIEITVQNYVRLD